jgi:hypothetical protein
MADPYVREIGDVTTDMEESISVGVDCDAVGIYIGGWLSADGITLTQHQAEEFAQLFVSAVWQAGANARQMAQEIHEADGGDTMAGDHESPGDWPRDCTGPPLPVTGSSRKIGRDWCGLRSGTQARLVSFGGVDGEAFAWIDTREAQSAEERPVKVQ